MKLIPSCPPRWTKMIPTSPSAAPYDSTMLATR